VEECAWYSLYQVWIAQSKALRLSRPQSFALRNPGVEFENAGGDIRNHNSEFTIAASPRAAELCSAQSI
jgi:hypothetical protein